MKYILQRKKQKKYLNYSSNTEAPISTKKYDCIIKIKTYFKMNVFSFSITRAINIIL